MDPETSTLLAALPPHLQEAALNFLRVNAAGAPAGGALDSAARIAFAGEVRRLAREHAAAQEQAAPPVYSAPPTTRAATPPSPSKPSTPAPWAPLPAGYDAALAETLARMGRAATGEAAGAVLRQALAELWARPNVRAIHGKREELVAAVELKIHNGTRPRS